MKIKLLLAVAFFRSFSPPTPVQSQIFHQDSLLIEITDPSYDFFSFKQQILHPELQYLSDVRKWALEYKKIANVIAQKDSASVADDQMFHYILQELTPKVVQAKHAVIRARLYIAFDAAAESDSNVIQKLDDLQHEALDYIETQLKLRAPQRLIFIYVQSDSLTAPQTSLSLAMNGGSRFLAVNRADIFALDKKKIGQFRRRFKHVLAQIWLRDIVQTQSRHQLPEWFLSVAAIQIANSEKNDFQNIKLVESAFQPKELVSLAEHLERERGSDTFIQFLKRSIRYGNPNTQLFKLYGYFSTDESIDQAVAINARLGRWIEDKLHLRNRFIRYSALHLILLIFLIFSCATFWKSADWRISIPRLRRVSRKFNKAVSLFENKEFEAALDRFNIFFQEVYSANILDAVLLSFQTKIDKARQYFNETQEELLDTSIREINIAISQKSEDAEAEQIENLCFQLERLQLKFDVEYAGKAEKYLQRVAPQAIKTAWTTRKERFKHAEQPKEISEFIQHCLDYSHAHNQSGYYASEQIDEELGKLCLKWSHFFETGVADESACESYLLTQKMADRCKSTESLLTFEPELRNLAKRLQIFCQMEQISRTFDNGKRLDALHSLEELLPGLEYFYKDQALRDNILDFLGNHLRPQTAGESDKQEDVFFNQMRRELVVGLLEKVIDVCGKAGDSKRATTLKKQLQELNSLPAAFSEVHVTDKTD